MQIADPAPVDFSYGAGASAGFAPAAGEVPVNLSIFADRAVLRASLRDDATVAGLTVTCAAPLDALLGGSVMALGDVVLLDCPQVDGATLAALARLDERAAHACARLIVSTTMEALDDVFSCMDQSAPILLVDPSRADRLLALGRVLAELPGSRVRELSESDRLMLLRLTEQVGQIAGQIERLAPGPAMATAIPGGNGDIGTGASRERHVPSLPDARLLRRIIRQRQLRQRFIEGDLFADPAWDMLLDLTAARSEGARVSVTSLCIAAGVPPTTALRWIGQMVEAGLFVRTCDDADRRRAFIELSDKAADAMARYFAEIALDAPLPL